MRVSQFVSLVAIALLSTGAMAQSDDKDSQSAEGQDPDMQADTIEGQNQGATSQYEMSSEDDQTSDDVDAGDSGSPSAREQLMKGTRQEEKATPPAESTGGQH
ncbi:hypothetical protein R5R73_07060 [Salinicola sp. LHM]|uniref:hypothetical protein n=1 Tax=Salinicola sp. LHM TaxID=3065298 RepID=UPI002ACE0344|nr:hypothetical protein [Salinicola sp. LHM]WQH34441.1 hypothetical protein R5R73_07060 [Salinicola sp. LHM]